MPERPLHALTLRQPLASLLVLGHKVYDTHPIKPPAGAVGQPLAIFAHPKSPPTSTEALTNLMRLAGLDRVEVPLGAFVGIVTMHEAKPADEVARGLLVKAAPNMPDEMHIGNFEPGVWAWRFGNRRAINPVPWRGDSTPGGDGLWEVPTTLLQPLRDAYAIASHAGGMSAS